VRKNAICAGSGADFIERAMISGADIFITGDIKYHQALDAVCAGIVLVDIGHNESEVVYLTRLAQLIKGKFSDNPVGVFISKISCIKKETVFILTY